jgi:hypothetical protein
MIAATVLSGEIRKLLTTEDTGDAEAQFACERPWVFPAGEDAGATAEFGTWQSRAKKVFA